jgi:tetratricopeptide (TPR) repeat protein
MSLTFRRLFPKILGLALAGSVVLPVLIAAYIIGPFAGIREITGKDQVIIGLLFLVEIIVSFLSGLLFVKYKSGSIKLPHKRNDRRDKLYVDIKYEGQTLNYADNYKAFLSMPHTVRGFSRLLLLFRSLRVERRYLYVLLCNVLVLLISLIIALFLGIKPPHSWVLSLSFDTSIVLGIALAYGWYIVHFNEVYCQNRLLQTHFVILSILTFSIITFGIIDDFLKHQFISFVIVQLSSSVFYFILTNNRLYRGVEFESNFPYTGAILAVNKIMKRRKSFLKQRAIISMRKDSIKRARIFLDLLTFWYRIKRHDLMLDKDFLKLKVLFYYRIGHYKNALSTVERGNARLIERGDVSETLVSLKAMAQLNMGCVEEAGNTLVEALQKSPNNQHYMRCSAYLAWHQGDIDTAISFLSEAIEILQKEQALLASVFRAHLLCELALTQYPKNALELHERADEAHSLLQQAMDQGNATLELAEIYFENQLDYMLGYVYLLKGEYKKALRLFSQRVWHDSHLRSRFCIGLLHMIGTSNYTTAITHFQRIIDALDVKDRRKAITRISTMAQRPSHFRLCVKKNLERVLEAKKRHIVFNEDIIFYHMNFAELIPSDSIAYIKKPTGTTIYDHLEHHHDDIFSFDYFPEIILKNRMFNLRKTTETLFSLIGRFRDNLINSAHSIQSDYNRTDC